MRVAGYNIFEGAETSLPQLEQFVNSQELDILCLQEANNWLDGESSQIDRFAAATGLTNIVSGGNRRFKIATMSRLPIAAEKVHTDGFWHGAVEIVVDAPSGPLTVWNTHFCPLDEDQRLPEAAYISTRVSANERALVTGDFNSLSSIDQYPDDLSQTLAAKGITKFGTTHNRYDVIQLMLDGGLVDVAAAHKANVSTVPTPVNTDSHHADALRLDYMFATPLLLKAIVSIETLKNELTDSISDHYPQVVSIEDRA